MLPDGGYRTLPQQRQEESPSFGDSLFFVECVSPPSLLVWFRGVPGPRRLRLVSYDRLCALPIPFSRSTLCDVFDRADPASSGEPPTLWRVDKDEMATGLAG